MSSNHKHPLTVDLVSCAPSRCLMALGWVEGIFLSRQMTLNSRFFREWLIDLSGCWKPACKLFRRQLSQQYRYSWLGLFWAVVPSFLTALVLIGGRHGNVLGDGPGIPAAFYGVFGLAMAQLFLEAVNSTRLVFTNNQQLFRRCNVPLDGFIVAAFLGILFSMLVRIGVISMLLPLFGVLPVVATLPLACAGFLAIALLGAGLGLLVAPLNGLKRDIDHVFSFFPWVLFAVTPVFFPISSDSIFGFISNENPLTSLFEAVRAATYGGLGEPWLALPAVVLGFIVIFVGWMFCRLARPHVIERFLE